MTADSREDYFPVNVQNVEPDVRAVLPGLRDLMSQPELSAVRPAQTGVLSEGPHGADLVIQHPKIKGFCLAIAIGGRRATLYWAHVDLLDRKDELDEARGWAHASAELDDDGAMAVVGLVRQELDAPLSVVETWHFGKRSTVEIRVSQPGGAPGSERAVWRRRERRFVPPFPGREKRRHGSFLSIEIP